jgi:hypothetical protein
MSVLLRQGGLISFKALFILFLLFAVIHIGIKVVPPYLDAERIKDEMAVMARLAQTLKDEEIMADLLKKAKELDLPLGQDKFTLLRDDENRRMKIITQWDIETVFFWGIYRRTFHFAPVIEEDYARRF